MSEPTRLFATPNDATPLERDLLRAGRAEALAPREKARVWTAISAHASSATAVGAGAAKALTGASLLKGTLAAVVLGGGALFGARALRPAHVPAAAIVAPPEAVPMPEPAPALAPRPSPAPVVVPEPVTAHRPPPSHLAAEGRLVLEARRELRGGDPAAALRRLEAARAVFADGALVQEREALTIEALQRTGRGEAAARRAQDFLRAYPGSPHAASVRRFAAP